MILNKKEFFALFMDKFNYCPLIWMYHNRTYNDLLEKGNSVSKHHKILKVRTKASSEIMQEVFLVKEQGDINLRNQADFLIPQVRSVNFGLKSIQVLGPKIWERLPKDLKNKELFNSFKAAIKRWKPESCSYCLL